MRECAWSVKFVVFHFDFGLCILENYNVGAANDGAMQKALSGGG